MTLCGCGCGDEAGVYKGSNSSAGIVAGQPKTFIHGHHSRVQPSRRPAFDDCYTILDNGCWQWKRIYAGDDGYGSYCKQQAHRYSYSRVHGEIPVGAHLDHVCHDPRRCPGGASCPHRACVNPAHLKPSTHAENCRRGALAKLDMEKAREIRTRFAAGEHGTSLAREFGVRPTTVSMLIRNRTWREDVA